LFYSVSGVLERLGLVFTFTPIKLLKIDYKVSFFLCTNLKVLAIEHFYWLGKKYEEFMT